MEKKSNCANLLFVKERVCLFWESFLPIEPLDGSLTPGNYNNEFAIENAPQKATINYNYNYKLKFVVNTYTNT